jgi:aminoglycoside phosphotransferase (APT) family kinase protein
MDISFPWQLYEVIGCGATSTIYRDGDSAVKLYVNVPLEEVAREAQHQTFVRDAGLPVPAVYGVRQFVGNTVALYMQYINGQPLLNAQMSADECLAAMATLVKLQCDVHQIREKNQPKQSEQIKRRINEAQQLDAAAKSRLLALHSRLDDGANCLCHGDFHPLNVLYDGSRHWIIDWVDATIGHPHADACRTYLMLKHHINSLSELYLHTFCAATNCTESDILNWLPVIAASLLYNAKDPAWQNTLLGIIQK